MPTGGTVNVSASNLIVGEKETIPLESGKYVRIYIRDKGIGMSPEQLSRIFEPYYTTKQKGSGLGLATAFSIVRNHGGYITAESKQNSGSDVHVYLPASEETAPKIEEIKKEEPIRGRGYILVMDDEEVIRELLSRMLPLSGYEVETAGEGEETIRKYKEARDAGRPFDAVIMDLTIAGGMGGKEAIKKLLEIDPDAKVVVSSGYANDPIMSDYKDYGFKAVITKPYSVRRMEETLSDIL